MSDIVLASKKDQFHVWITVLLKSYEMGVIHGLVKRGYNVSAADSSGQISSVFKGAASAVIGLHVEKDVIGRTDLLNDIHIILEEMQAQFFSIVVSEYTLNCTWMGTNIHLTKEDVLEPKPVDRKAN